MHEQNKCYYSWVISMEICPLLPKDCHILPPWVYRHGRLYRKQKLRLQMGLSLLGISCPQDRVNILNYPMGSVITTSLKWEERGRRESEEEYRSVISEMQHHTLKMKARNHKPRNRVTYRNWKRQRNRLSPRGLHKEIGSYLLLTW